MSIMPYGRDDLMAVAAVRYCIGRASYTVAECREWLCAAWTSLSNGARDTIQRSVEEAFKRDDSERNEGYAAHLPLGWDCDREEWEKVRKLWRGEGK